jgi:sugar phosphate isomerase/epimerase
MNPSAPPILFSSVQRKRLAQAISPIAPSVLVWQAYAMFLANGGTLVEAVEEVASMNFFASIEIPMVDDISSRRRLSQIAEETGWEVLVWASDVQAEERLNLAALDGDERQRARRRFHELVQIASECGAQRLGFCSPPDRDPGRRPESLQVLADELIVLAMDALSAGVSIVFEALDRHAHKKGLLGTAAELSDLSNKVRRSMPNFGVTWDTAHAALNGEELVTSFKSVESHALFVHFSEAILDRTHPQFGDWHLPIGSGEVLKPDVVQRLLLTVLELCRSEKRRVALAVEEYNRDPKISGADSLRRAWSYLSSCL